MDEKQREIYGVSKDEMSLDDIHAWFEKNCPAISAEEIDETYEKEPEYLREWIEHTESENERRKTEFQRKVDSFNDIAKEKGFTTEDESEQDLEV